jgi:hypothetical protein
MFVDMEYRGNRIAPWMTAGLSLRRLPVCLLLLAMTAVQVQAAGQAQERQIKAAYIYNFAKFTSWPTAAFADQGTLNLCIAGQDRLSGDIRQLQGKHAKGKRINVQQLSGSTVPDSCQMLYVASSKRGNFQGLMNDIKGKPVLTISEISRFSRSGGVIELYVYRGKVRFMINQTVARRSGLSISSRLLKLAKVVGG